jgi:hypothetical protein
MIPVLITGVVASPPSISIGVITLLSLIAAILTILEYFKYVPDVAVLVNNPKVITTLHKDFFRRYQVKKFWEPILKIPAVIVIPAQDLDDLRNSQEFDHQGSNELVHQLNKYFRKPELDVVPVNRFSSENYKNHNIILIAGPIPNPISGDLLYNNHQQDIPCQFEKLSTGKVINSITCDSCGINESPMMTMNENESSKNMKRDFGIITKAKSIYNRDRVMINIAGGFGEGTLAGVRMLTNPEYIKYINKNADSCFQLVYTVPISSNNEILEPELITEHNDEYECAILSVQE